MGVRATSRRWLHLLWVGFIFVPMLVFAGSSPGNEGALWVNADHSVFKISPVDGSPELELGSLSDIQSLAVDLTTGNLWINNHKHLWAYDSQGDQLVSKDLPHNLNGDDPAGMAVDGTAGNVWIGIHRKLYRFDLNGSLQDTKNLDRDIVAVALDSTRSHLWVADTRILTVLDKTGNQLFKVQLNRSPDLLVYDTSLDQVWVVSGRMINRYDASGNKTFTASVRVDINDHIAPDGQGGLWAVSRTTLSYIDESGDLAFNLTPFSTDSDHDSDSDEDHKIIDLVTDPLNHTAWVADKRYLEQYATDSTLKQSVDMQSIAGHGPGIRHMALYAGASIPTISFTAPKNLSYTNLSQPAFTLTWSDTGAGIDPTTLKVTLNGLPIAVNCSSSDSGAQCAVASSLADGSYTLSATVADYAGNSSTPASVTFTIDTIPPPLPFATAIGFVAGPDGNVTLVGQIGSVASDVASVTITNIRTGLTVTGSVNSDGSFSISVPGTSSDEFAITLTDLAGNVTAPFYMHGSDVPLQLSITSPIASATIPGNVVNVSGTFQGPVNTGITVNGVPAVLSAGQWVANNISLTAGANTITVTALTSGGLTSTQMVNVTSNGTSALILTATPSATGVTPLAVTFQYQFFGTTTPQSLSIDYTGGGNYVAVSDPNTTLSYTYSSPGIYTVTLILTDSNNAQYQAQIMVVVEDANQMDALFKGIWGDMTTALASGDKVAAMNELDGTAQRNYGHAFDVLLPHMQQIVSTFSPLLRSSISTDIGEYVIVRPDDGQENTFFIYFLKDQNGIWRLDSM